MHVRRLVLAAAVALAAVLVAAPPAGAGVLYTYDFAERATGMPATEEPSRTLQSAALERYDQFDLEGERVVLRAELGSEPTPGTDAVLHVAMGQIVDGVCATTWEAAVSTLEPGEGATREAAVITVTRADTDATPGGWDCGWVEILDPVTGATLDRLEGTPGTVVIVDPAPGINVRLRDDAKVAVRRWDAIRLRLYPRGDASRVILGGHGEDLRVRRVVLDADELAYRPDLAWLPVRLMVDQPRRLVVVARAWNEQGERIGIARLRVRLLPRG